ncbi:MAG: hypothetical protein KTR32_30445, partial [Granulosicoccus sp.]|nr:hypothetical protein [Granulosicoccus sp.]
SLLSHEAPTEMAVEALRNLRTSLHFGMLDKTNGVVAITGPSPEVGKSFVTLNLGYLAAQAGARVLIVDADLRRGTIGKAFDLERSTEGLSDVLSGHTSIESAIHRVEVNSVGDVTSAPDEDICRDWTVSFNQNGATQNSRGKPLSLAVGDTVLEIPTELTLQLDVSDRGNVETHARLDIVPRGKAPPNPSELLMHIRFSEFISQMSEQYDLVLLDTPPVLAATDALIASKYADMSLVVVCHGKTRITEYQQVLKMFQQNQSSVTGVVLNNYDPKNGRYGAYGETYGYQYDYR